MAFNRCTQCPLYCPPRLESLLKSMNIEPQLFAPLRHCVVFATVKYTYITTSIVRLLLSSCPPAIIRIIPFGIIYSFKACANRPFPHIGNKIIEFFPPNTHLNSTGAISFVVLIFRIIASDAHGNPRPVLGAFSTANSMTILHIFSVAPHKQVRDHSSHSRKLWWPAQCFSSYSGASNLPSRQPQAYTITVSS